MQNNVQYNYNDIQRYLQKQMSKEEMYAFEKAMMEDPFLADALEGYQAVDDDTTKKHLAEIHKGLQGANTKRKVVSIKRSSNTWWKVAAIFLLVTSLGILSYHFLTWQRNDNINIAAKEALKPPSTVDSIKPIVESDSATFKEGLFSSKPLASKTRKSSGSPIVNPAPNPAAPLPVASDEEVIAMRLQSPDTVSALVSNAPTSSPLNLLREKMERRKMDVSAASEITGKVVDAAGSPLPGANVLAKNNAATTDAKGNFTIKAPDTAVDVSIAALGYQPTTKRLKTATPNNTIVLEQESSILSEVLVTSLRNRGTPVGGWDVFINYLDSAVRVAKSENKSLEEGTVELEFKVDEKGNPVQIKTRSKVNKTLKDKAISILKQGPRWRPTRRNTKPTVVIEF